jgi:hypothetical protein
VGAGAVRRAGGGGAEPGGEGVLVKDPFANQHAVKDREARALLVLDVAKHVLPSISLETPPKEYAALALAYAEALVAEWERRCKP